MATATIEAPASGFLVIDAGSDVGDTHSSHLVVCHIEVDNARASGSERRMELDAGAAEAGNREEDCSTNAVVPIAAGMHTVDLEGAGSEFTYWGDTALSAIYVPFDGTGAPPSSDAISAAQE